MDQNSHIVAQKEWEGCSLFPQNQEEESYSARGLSSPPSCPFEASSELFFHHEVLSQQHGESNTCQTIAQTSS
jgi:hypothetical protein